MSSLLKFLLIIQDPAGEKREVEIPTGATLIGRQPGVALQLDQPKVSRHHARIDCSGQECTLTDLNSANGTLLDGKKIQPSIPYPLASGAVILIGDYSLRFEQIKVEISAPIAQVASPPMPEAAIPQAQTPSAMLPESVEPPGMPPGLPPVPPSGLDYEALPGMDGQSRFLINYLPETYQTEFMASFLGIFESILLPVEWSIDNFDLYLSPGTSPSFFLSWLANWFGLALDATWSDAQRRTLLAEAHQLYAMRGTRWALSRLLEIYTGQKPAINDTGQDQKPYSFTVRFTGKQYQANRKFIQRLIEENKPAHTNFVLEIEE